MPMHSSSASPGMKCLPPGEVTARAGLPSQASYRRASPLPIAANRETDVGALGDECPYSRQRLVEAARHAGVGARQQQNAFVAAGLDRRPAAQDCMLALDHQLCAFAAERTRPCLVFN